MIRLKSDEDIENLKQGGKILAHILDEVEAAVQPGVTTWELNELAENLISKSGAEPSFKNYNMGKGIFYPASLCTSVNSVIVHGVPKKDEMLGQGDIVGVDLGLKWNGLYVDSARTIGVGKISELASRLIKVTEECLEQAIGLLRPGAKLGDLGARVESMAQENGFSVIRDLVGHGVGYKVHEEPKVPNFGLPGTGEAVVPGMVLAVEPMISTGDYKLKHSKDGFGCELADGSLGAHAEHTVAITRDGAIILTKCDI